MLATLGRAAVLAQGLGVRDQVRRRARGRRAPRGRGAHARPQRRGHHRALPRDRRGAARASASSTSCSTARSWPTTTPAARASAACRSACCISQARATSRPMMARVPVRAVFFDCLALEGRDLRKLALRDRKECLARVAAAGGRRAGGRPRRGARGGVLRSRLRDGARGDHREARRQPLHGQALHRLGQDQVPAPAGIRDRRLHRAARRRAALRRAARRRLRGRPAPPRHARRQRLRRRHAGSAVASAPAAARARTRRSARSGPERRERSLGGAASSCAKCASPSGPPTAGCAIPSSSGCAPTKARGDPARGRTRLRERDDREHRGADPPPRPRAKTRRGRPRSATAGRVAARRRPPSRAIVRLSNLQQGVLAGRAATPRAISSPTTTRSRRSCCPTSRTARWCSRATPTASRASRSSRRTRRCSCPTGCAPRSVYSKDTDRDIRFFVIDDAESLRYVANLGTIPIHMWSARSGSLEQPDWLVLDLDPKGAPFAHVIEVARSRCASCSRSWSCRATPKTSGRDRPAHPDSARAALHARGVQDVRAPARDAGAAGEARDLDARAPAPCARRQGLRRLGAERARHHHRRAVFAAPAARGAGIVPAASGAR